MINNKIYKNKNMNDSEFYFDIEKFILLYKFIKKYEVEDGYINKDVFFSIFVRQYLIVKNNYPSKKRKNSDDSEESNNNNMNININYFYNEEIIPKQKQNILNNNINTNINQFPLICQALKKLTTKQIKRIYYCFGINIQKLNYIQKLPQEIKKENKRISVVESMNEKKDKRKSVVKTLKRRQTMNQINNSKFLSLRLSNKKENKTIKEETQKINTTKSTNTLDETKKENNNEINEYNTYLNTKEIFTILPLLGVNILTPEEEDKIEKEFNNKLIMGKYLNKKDFFEYKFWFESFFEFYLMDENDENKGIKLLKEFLFDLWKNDENSSYFNFDKFFNSLKVNKYVTDFTDFNEVRYYDIVFS